MKFLVKIYLKKKIQRQNVRKPAINIFDILKGGCFCCLCYFKRHVNHYTKHFMQNTVLNINGISIVKNAKNVVFCFCAIISL